MKIILFIERFLLLNDTSLIINGDIFINIIDSIIKLFFDNLVAMCNQVKSNFILIRYSRAKQFFTFKNFN